MSVLQALCCRALSASNISPAALFRSIEKWRPTLLIDEADTFMRQNDELRGIINSGHTRSTAHVIRCDGDKNEPEVFSTWAAKSIAGIGRQAETIMDRSIEISMRRRLPEEKVERFRGDQLEQFEDLRRECLRWVIDNEDAVKNSDPNVPDFLGDRAADNWRALLQIAEVAGDTCLAKAAEALHALSSDRPEEDESAGIMLLRDMQSFFGQSSTGRILSDDLVHHIYDIEDRPWSEWGRSRKPISKRQVAQLLRPFGIRPREVRNGQKKGKGYRIEDCQDAFSRYIPTSQNATPRQPSNGADSREKPSATQDTDVADEKLRISSNDEDCRDVAFDNPQSDNNMNSDRVVEEF